MMKRELQVCRLDLAKRLEELGVKQESLFYWEDRRSNGLGLHLFWDGGKNDAMYPTFSAFTVAELGEMLPFNFASQRNNYHGDRDWVCFKSGTEFNVFDGTEADARAKMLINLIETGAVKP